MKNIVLLGSTGSIGTQTLNVIRRNADKFKVIALAANENAELLSAQADQFKPKYVGICSAEKLPLLNISYDCEVFSGKSALSELASVPEADIVVCAVAGMSAFDGVISAVEQGKDVALASKEVLVMAGALVMEAVKQKKVRLIPVDSEHSAIFQCLEGKQGGLRRVILTASGGPFREYPREALENVTCAEALRHPTWNMGPKVTLDSATLMNKALEMMEAHHLFSVDADRIDVLVHPQSVVHSMVEFEDGVVMAQMSRPDMRFPIQYALTYPDRCDGGLARLDLPRLSGLTFEEPDTVRFPSLLFASEAIRRGGIAGAVMNAANEVAVERFRAGELKFTGIFDVVEQTMNQFNQKGAADMNTILEADQNAREFARQLRKG